MSRKLSTVTASELMSTVLESREEIVDDLIPQGICILAGPQKVGKSFLALDIAVSVSIGKTVLGRATVQGECLYLGLEDTYPRLQNRLFLLDAEATDALHFATAAGILGNGLELQIEDFAQEHPNLRLVVIDVLQLVRNNTKSSYSSEYSELRTLRDLANRLGISILIIMHTKKKRDQDPLNNIYGYGGVVAIADSILVLTEEHRGSGNCTLLCTGREIESIELRLQFDRESMKWLVVDEPTSMGNTESKALAAVYVFIRKKKHFEGSASDLIEELKSVSTDKFHPNRITRDLMKEGHKLAEYGILFAVKRNHSGRIIILHYVEEDDMGDPTVARTWKSITMLEI